VLGWEQNCPRFVCEDKSLRCLVPDPGQNKFIKRRNQPETEEPEY